MTTTKAKPAPGGDLRVDDYLARAPEFARPILRHLRALVHAGCPEVEETIKWSRPFFTHRGRILCNMSAFKAHCAFGFWQPDVAGNAMRDNGKTEEAAGQFGRITRLEDLPDDTTLRGYVAEAVRLMESGAPTRMRPSGGVKSRVEPALPLELASRLQDDARLAEAFGKFAPSCRREYIEWIAEAKRPETRQKRLDAAVGLIAEGKPRHWKYQS